MVEVRVQSLGVDPASKAPVVLLEEVAGDRVLPIWIGTAEAHAIAMELAGMKFSRPLTHDLMASLIRGLGGSMQRAIISRVHDNTYFAELVLVRDGAVFSVDARPSDSIALALRLKAPLFTSEELLSGTASAANVAIASAQEEHTLSAEELQEHLKKLAPEDLGRFNP